MRVLLDESVPRPLARLLGDHRVLTVHGVGWAGVSNGELLRRAARDFDVLVTADRSLPHQQDLRDLALGVVVIAARDNRAETVVALADRIREALEDARGGRVVIVEEEP